MARKLKETQSAVIDWFCPKCGKDVSMEDEKCPHCDAKFVPIGSISEEEARLQELQEKISEATTKKKEDKKEKAEKKEAEAPEKKSKRKLKSTEKKELPSSAPRPGTRKAFVFEALTTKGLKYATFSPKFAKEFDLSDSEALKGVKTILYHFKRDGFTVVEEKGLWKLSL